MFVKGLNDRTLTTSGKDITIGANNRAWITDYAQDDSAYWAYWHLFLGGTMEFDVNVSQLSCNEVAGVYLVDLDDADCSWNSKDSAPESCSTVDIMEANTVALRTSQTPCVSGKCTGTQTKSTTGTEYGAGSGFTIDSTQAYKVSVKFYGTQRSDGDMENLSKVETILTQNGNTVTLVCDDSAFLLTLSSKLNYNMAVVVSNYDAGSTNEVAGSCPPQSSSSSNLATLGNFSFTVHNSLNDDTATVDDTIVFGDIAPSINDCNDEFCGECRTSWYSLTPTTTFYSCYDYTKFVYRNRCRRGGDLCGANDKCFSSYPSGDNSRTRSPDYKCRGLPNRLEVGPWDYSSRRCRNRRGLCPYGGCSTRQCAMSWPQGDADRWRSDDAMCRCR
jgi:hypothetical protein